MWKKIKHNRLHVILFFLILFGFNLYEGSNLDIIDNYVKKPLKGSNSTAAYFKVVNKSQNKVLLREIRCKGVSKTSFHKMEIDSETELMKMISLKSIELMPNSIRKFSPMKEHIMMMGLEKGFDEKSTVIYSLYANGNEITWSFPLK